MFPLLSWTIWEKKDPIYTSDSDSNTVQKTLHVGIIYSYLLNSVYCVASNGKKMKGRGEKKLYVSDCGVEQKIKKNNKMLTAGQCSSLKMPRQFQILGLKQYALFKVMIGSLKSGDVNLQVVVETRMNRW